MKRGVCILVAENDDEEFSLIEKNLHRSGLRNEVIRFSDGQALLDFLYKSGPGFSREQNKEYLLLMNLGIPGIDGLEVLGFIKADTALKKIPVIILTSHDDPVQLERCYSLGCSICIIKPDDKDGFETVIQKCGAFLSAVEVPQIKQS